MLTSQYTLSYLNTTLHSMLPCRHNLNNLNTKLINLLHFVEHHRRYIHSLINKSLKKTYLCNEFHLLRYNLPDRYIRRIQWYSHMFDYMSLCLYHIHLCLKYNFHQSIHPYRYSYLLCGHILQWCHCYSHMARSLHRISSDHILSKYKVNT